MKEAVDRGSGGVDCGAAEEAARREVFEKLGAFIREQDGLIQAGLDKLNEGGPPETDSDFAMLLGAMGVLAGRRMELTLLTGAFFGEQAENPPAAAK